MSPPKRWDNGKKIKVSVFLYGISKRYGLRWSFLFETQAVK